MTSRISNSSAATAEPAKKSGSTNSKPAPKPGKDELLAMFEVMFRIRQFETVAGAMNRKGEMPGFLHLYIGEEAVATGICAHLKDTDWITSTHRGHGHALAKGMTPRALMAELYAKVGGCCAGRGGSMHLYDPKHGIYGTNGIVGAGLPHTVGAALSGRTRGTDSIAVAFFGDGATSHGAFHESLNFAGAQNAGVLFVCENNLYATATPLTMATKNTEIWTRAAAYGIPGYAVDGNDALAVWEVARVAVERARKGEGPTLIEAKTYRTVGHHEGDPLTGTYREQPEIDEWKLKDPVPRMRKYLLDAGVKQSEIDAIETKIKAEIDDSVEFARKSPEPETSTYFDFSWSEKINPEITNPDPAQGTKTQGWLDAVRDGIAEEMRRNPHTIYFGEGIGVRGGSFAHTKGLFAEFGGKRVVDTPICELGFTGASIGASATGTRAVADLMFMDFLFETGGQIPLQAAKLRYMSNNQMFSPVIFRTPCGAVRSAGPHHSGTYHSMWSHLPGIIVVMPSNPADAKGLMKTAFRGSDPVIFMEPKALFASKGEVPVGEYNIPFGVARIAREGSSLTMVAAGRMVSFALEAADALAKEGINSEVIDLRTIVPLDIDTIIKSVEKTNHLLVVDEGYAMCGIGGEIAASIAEQAFDSLDAPIGRVHLDPVSHPVAPGLEEAAMPNLGKIIAAAKSIMNGTAPKILRPYVDRPGRAAAPASPVVTPVESVSATPAAVKPEVPVKKEEAKPAVQRMEGEPIDMPHGDLTVSEGIVVNWLKKVGDEVKQGEAIVEVETDKAVLQVEAPAGGKLIQVLAEVGKTVKMGETMGVIGK
jgi:2-oxoisovalerate dehydrogenase E1 component